MEVVGRQEVGRQEGCQFTVYRLVAHENTLGGEGMGEE